jgi:DNA-binding XRE family transcriptional regulator
MSKTKMYAETELAALAKRFREGSGKSKALMARELGVTRAAMQDAEEHPDRSMTRLRCRIIESCSPYRVAGPGYWLEKQTQSCALD